MSKRIGILNNYADEPESAPSANYFRQFLHKAEVINICHGQRLDDIEKYDGYIISGSRSSHKDDASWIKYLERLTEHIYGKYIPCLAVCFGHQLVASIFGGKTVIGKNGEEGFQDIPTKIDNDIDIFANLPNPVKIYQSHNDAVLKAPPNSKNIISNDKCVQYFQFNSIYSIQSHPEISVENAVMISERDNQNKDRILNGVNVENIQSHIVLENFVKIVQDSIK